MMGQRDGKASSGKLLSRMDTATAAWSYTHWEWQ